MAIDLFEQNQPETSSPIDGGVDLFANENPVQNEQGSSFGKVTDYVANYFGNKISKLKSDMEQSNKDALRFGELYRKVKNNSANEQEKVEFNYLQDKTLKETQGIALGISGGASGATESAAKTFGLDIAKKARSGAEYLMDKALGTPGNVIEKGRSPAAAAVKEGYMGTGRMMETQAKKVIADVNPKIQDILKSQKGTTNVFSEVNKIVDKLKQKGSAFTPKEIIKIIKSANPVSRDLIDKGLQGSLTWKEKDLLRQNLDQVIGDRGFMNAQPEFNRGVVKDFANALRENIQTKIPETKPLFKKFSTAINVAKTLNKTLSKNYMIPFLTISAPSALGSILGDPKAGIEAGIALELLREGRKSPLVLSSLAQATEKVANNPDASRGLAKMLVLIGQRMLSKETENQ